MLDPPRSRVSAPDLRRPDGRAGGVEEEAATLAVR